MITLGSLFSGIGGLELGIERGLRGAGFDVETKWQVEIDPFCRRVLARHWPHASRFNDVFYFGGQVAPPVDVICGGFPCQDLSVAGNGAGLDGARSGLFWRFARIIRELEPRVVVMENVSGLLARGLGRLLGELATIGYDAEWDCVPASAVGAPHQRDRVWIVAHAQRDRGRLESEWREQRQAERRYADALHPRAPWEIADTNGWGREILRWSPQQPELQRGRFVDGRRGPGTPLPDTNGDDGRHEGRSDRSHARNEGLADVAHTDVSRLERTGVSEQRDGRSESRAWNLRSFEWGQSPPPVRRVDDGLPAGVDRPRRRRPPNDKHRLKALGNAVVPHVAEVVGARVVELLRGAA